MNLILNLKFYFQTSFLNMNFKLRLPSCGWARPISATACLNLSRGTWVGFCWIETEFEMISTPVDFNGQIFYHWLTTLATLDTAKSNIWIHFKVVIEVAGLKKLRWTLVDIKYRIVWYYPTTFAKVNFCSGIKLYLYTRKIFLVP